MKEREGRGMRKEWWEVCVGGGREREKEGKRRERGRRRETEANCGWTRPRPEVMGAACLLDTKAFQSLA